MSREACIDHEEEHMLELAEHIHVNEGGGQEITSSQDSWATWQPDPGHLASSEGPTLRIQDSESTRLFGPRSPQDVSVSLESGRGVSSAHHDQPTSWATWQPDPVRAPSPEGILRIPEPEDSEFFGPRNPQGSRISLNPELEVSSAYQGRPSSWATWQHSVITPNSEEILRPPAPESPRLFGPGSPRDSGFPAKSKSEVSFTRQDQSSD
ncbi:hypothetical protein DL96DRAFT_1616910 [Flagelloscypha sp. PMI_526]|nr:hypothetical protein DL96DRAFT_1616910 [Flagelloscypha sp. PMI_526]